jgi:hypothetical protein
LAVYKEGGVVSISEETNKTTPKEFLLNQNYPNPFNPTTIISYQLLFKSKVTLKVFDLLSREITTLVNEEKPAGNNEVEFSVRSCGNGTNLPSGVYFYKLETGGNIFVKKMILVR